jgi:UDP-N-acetylmuramoyl-L-alanyl-D-glutamate--2,6-diaminopimelate ligase
MKLKKLVDKIPRVSLKNGKDIPITGLASDSRTVAFGDLFIARKGLANDGKQFIRQAMDAGAKAIATDLYDPFIKLPQVIYPKGLNIEAVLAARFYDNPSKKLFCVGVTGTKGKTTTSYLVRHFLDDIGCSLMSTSEIWLKERQINDSLTTRDCVFHQKLLREAVEQKMKAAVIEASSHGLDQGRVEGIDFDAALFTNLSADHLDYHPDMEHYASAKAKLFQLCQKTHIVNGDSPWADRMSRSHRITFGIETKCDVQAQGLVLNDRGAIFRVEGVQFSSPLLGIFNVYNALGAIALGLSYGKTLEEMAEKLAIFPGVPGRLERVVNEKGIHLFVDFAHSGDALEKVLFEMRRIAKRRLIVVFGSGGNRDVARRLEMGRAADQFADLAIITSDNPRKEDPEAICRDILSQFRSKAKARVCVDRREAIFQAVKEAKSEDIVIIAGRGHEKVQIFSGQTVRFDDVSVAMDALKCC